MPLNATYKGSGRPYIKAEIQAKSTCRRLQVLDYQFVGAEGRTPDPLLVRQTL